MYRYYRSGLVLVASVFALLLVLETGLMYQGTAAMFDRAENQIATVVGVSASIEPNEVNVITATLQQREKNLDDREAAIAAREKQRVEQPIEGSDVEVDMTTILLSIILTIMTVLIIFNFYLDWRYRRADLISS